VLIHVLAVLGLAVYAFEVHRTVRRFGARRRSAERKSKTEGRGPARRAS
jgi:hypothetical protein